ncbi:MAG: thioredoxin family protein [Psychroserpens sp.]|nr:thioredoxin family protein [Psychroserpens sp.]
MAITKYIVYIGLLMALFSFAGSENELMKKAQEEEKNIVIYFSGSDWCINCIKFKKNILNHTEVYQLLEDEFIYYVADFPQRTKLDKSVTIKNETLAEKLNPKGIFPLLVIADDNLELLSVIHPTASKYEAGEILRNYIK